MHPPTQTRKSAYKMSITQQLQSGSAAIDSSISYYTSLIPLYLETSSGVNNVLNIISTLSSASVKNQISLTKEPMGNLVPPLTGMIITLNQLKVDYNEYATDAEQALNVAVDANTFISTVTSDIGDFEADLTAELTYFQNTLTPQWLNSSYQDTFTGLVNKASIAINTASEENLSKPLEDIPAGISDVLDTIQEYKQTRSIGNYIEGSVVSNVSSLISFCGNHKTAIETRVSNFDTSINNRLASMLANL